MKAIFIIGAARSGTKLIRDLIAEHPSVDKIPYDINYIWRLGNEKVPHDELLAEWLTPQMRQRILESFKTYHSGAPFLVEKTVSNSLRVPFIHSIFPEARFIHLIRDGRDVVESAYRQWLAPPNWGYILKKARTFPLTDAFGYARSYAKNTVRRLFVSDQKKIGTWGPRYKGIQEDVATKELLEVCAIQWTRSVEQALAGLSGLPPGQTLTIRYEEFVQNPYGQLKMIAKFAGIEPVSYLENMDLSIVTPKHIGKGFHNFSPEQRALVLSYIQNTLTLLKYAV